MKDLIVEDEGPIVQLFRLYGIPTSEPESSDYRFSIAKSHMDGSVLLSIRPKEKDDDHFPADFSIDVSALYTFRTKFHNSPDEAFPTGAGEETLRDRINDKYYTAARLDLTRMLISDFSDSLQDATALSVTDITG